MSVTDHMDQSHIEKIGQTNPAVEPEKVRRAREQLREVRKVGRKSPPVAGSPYGTRGRKGSRGFGTTYG
jgi:hypothetical protein